MTNTGKLIQDHRLTVGLSQKDLGNKLGWNSGQFVSNIERGLVGVPLKKANKVCKLLCMKREDLRVSMIIDFTAKVSKTLR